MNFCGKCTSPLSLRCSHCDFENPPEFSFCGKCATPLSGQTQVPKSTHIDKQLDKQEDKAAHEAERRQMTVMFCDLVGSTSLSEQLDPEDLRDVVRSYQETCAEVIDKHDGYIAQYLGDGLLVYFGFPLAHEDDAQRAVRAGLEIVGAMDFANSARPTTSTMHKLPLDNTQLQQFLQVRIGIHTGPVVVGEIGRGEKREQLALGDTLNFASRLQNSAEPNTVVISSATYRLTEGLFECRDLGLHTLKGVSAPVQMYRILGESAIRSRFEVAIAKGLTPLVGREQEVKLLLERWEQAKEGKGQAVLVSGEAGIGKSRLIQVLKERVAGDTHVRIESRCSPFYQNSALYPIIDYLQRYLFRREDTVEERLDKLESVLLESRCNVTPKEMVPLFASLLSIPLPDRYPTLSLSPKRYKQKLFESLLDWLLNEAEKQPIIRIFEDIQWADPSTLEYLSLLIDNVQAAPVYILITFRPDFKSPWTMKSHITSITLNRLTRRNVEAMIEKLADGKSLPEEIVKQIVTKTDGIPLFVEELTKMLLESGLLSERKHAFILKKPLPALDIPATLNDSLMSRLDRLGDVKELIQLCATLGKEFTYELVKAVSFMNDNTLQKRLNRLVEAELIFQKGLPPNSRYFFKHTLIQDAAYNSLLKSKRQNYHNLIAKTLESRFPDFTEKQPELIAYHLTHAGSREQAIAYWHKAGLKAVERSAHLEAVEHLKKGLQLLSELPGKLELTHQELELLTTLGGALRVTKGFAAPEVEEV
ncbi:MAG: AAA family ATPase, partial [Deltaproteobacteria bacterium]|nr:AAA family ATPase [Deltaproteobacteria bacterium]